MDTSIFAFASDLHDEGAATVLDRVRQAGLGGITVAFAYHAARDVFPHSPRNRVRLLEAGALYFDPDPSVWRDVPIEPRLSSRASERSTLRATPALARERDLSVHAWTVFLHTDRLEAELAPYVTRNAFGDPYPTDLCPANPGVRAYAVALARDVATRGVSSILSESLHYHPLEHGFHHERYFVDLSAQTRFLLGLCFCSSCCDAAAAGGVDAVALKRWTAAELTRAFDGAAQAGGELDVVGLRALAGGELGGLLDARCRAVAELVGEVTEASADRGVPVRFLDLAGGVKGYATGRPEGGPAADIAWQLGVDLVRVAEAADELVAVGYAADPRRVELDLARYRELLGADARIGVALRPTPPDCDSSENLGAKLSAARRLGVEQADFYHYGLGPLSALETIAEAL